MKTINELRNILTLQGLTWHKQGSDWIIISGPRDARTEQQLPYWIDTEREALEYVLDRNYTLADCED